MAPQGSFYNPVTVAAPPRVITHHAEVRMSQIKSVEGALRLARTIASDVFLYNKDKVAEGLQKDTLFELLEADISEGRELYTSRVAQEIRDRYNLLDRALVDAIPANTREMPTHLW